MTNIHTMRMSKSGFCRHLNRNSLKQHSGLMAPSGPGVWLIRLFRHLERVIDLDPKITDRALKLRMPQQQLDRPQVLCSTIDQRRLRAPSSKSST